MSNKVTKSSIHYATLYKVVASTLNLDVSDHSEDLLDFKGRVMVKIAQCFDDPHATNNTEVFKYELDRIFQVGREALNEFYGY